MARALRIIYPGVLSSFIMSYPVVIRGKRFFKVQEPGSEIPVKGFCIMVNLRKSFNNSFGEAIFYFSMSCYGLAYS